MQRKYEKPKSFQDPLGCLNILTCPDYTNFKMVVYIMSFKNAN